MEEQTELRKLINNLNDYGPRISKKKNRREKQSFRISNKTKVSAFRTKEKESEKESEENKLEKIKDDYNKFFTYIEDASTGINYDLFKDYFYSSVPSTLAKTLYETKDKKKNNELVELIKVRWSNLKDEIEKIP